jgi:hypothetical protein
MLSFYCSTVVKFEDGGAVSVGLRLHFEKLVRLGMFQNAVKTTCPSGTSSQGEKGGKQAAEHRKKASTTTAERASEPPSCSTLSSLLSFTTVLTEDCKWGQDLGGTCFARCVTDGCVKINLANASF